MTPKPKSPSEESVKKAMRCVNDVLSVHNLENLNKLQRVRLRSDLEDAFALALDHQNHIQDHLREIRSLENREGGK